MAVAAAALLLLAPAVSPAAAAFADGAASSSTNAPCTQRAMNKLLGPHSQTDLTAKWYACRYGFAVAAGTSDIVGFGAVLAKAGSGTWHIKRGVDDAYCMYAAPGQDCGGWHNDRIGLSQAHLLNLVYAAHLTVNNNVSITPPAPAHHRTFFAQGHDFRDTARKPHTLRISGDGTLFVKHMQWSTWSKDKAAGHGTAALNNCKPSCAGGTFSHYPVSVHLSKPTKCTSWVYDGVVIRWTQAKPAHFPRTYNASPYIFSCAY
jgi:hypothetical protein